MLLFITKCQFAQKRFTFDFTTRTNTALFRKHWRFKMCFQNCNIPSVVKTKAKNTSHSTKIFDTGV